MFYEPIRKILCPFGELEPLVPRRGKILDVGCGHGTFAQILAEKSSERKVLGIDPSATKITQAKVKEKKFGNLKFKVAYIDNLSNEKFDCIVVIDVLYLLPPQRMLKFLQKAKNLLKKSGILILKTDSREPKILHEFLKIEEFIMVKLLKFTHSEDQRLYFLKRDGYRKILREAGFTIKKEFVFRSVFPYQHPTYLATPG